MQLKSADIKLKKARGLFDWIKVYRLYLEGFPSYERKPFSIICNMASKGTADVWCCKVGRSTIGFATTINSDAIVLLDYLAVKKNERGRGYGSAVLAALSDQYSDRGILVEIESEYEEADNTAERRKRKKFYLSAGYRQLNVMADVFGTRMELLGKRCSVDFEEYFEFYRLNYSEKASENIIWAPHPEA